jgi:hypothetical protein
VSRIADRQHRKPQSRLRRPVRRIDGRGATGPDPTGTNHVTSDIDYAKLKADAYPLTMVIYAMVPTRGISAWKASAIARFLDYAAGPGQIRGVHAGQLPSGYLPLTAAMRAQTLKAARLVLKQAGGVTGRSVIGCCANRSTPDPRPRRHRPASAPYLCGYRIGGPLMPHGCGLLTATMAR